MAAEAADELLELAEGGVAGEVTGIRISAAAGELSLVAVEHRSLVPTRHFRSLFLCSSLSIGGSICDRDEC